MAGRAQAAARSLAIRVGYALSSLALIVAYPLLADAGRLAAVRLAAFATLVAVIIGVVANAARTRPQRWVVLLILGLALVNIAYAVVLVAGEWAFIASEMLNAAGNVVLFAAAMSAVLSMAPDIGGVVDTAIVGLAAGGLLWNFALLPRERATHTPVVTQIDVLLVVFALAGVLGAVVRLRPLGEGRLVPLWLLAVALVFALGGHIADGLIGPQRLYPPSTMSKMAAYTCVGIFGLNPGTYRLLRPAPTTSERLSGSRLWFLGVAVSVIPVALGVSQIVGGAVNGVLLVLGSGLVTALVMFRVRRLSVERQRAERALNHLASHDPLTGLVNRRELIEQLGTERSRESRSVILFCDLDKFKDVNDRLGHSAGDQLLVEVAKRLADSVRETDTVARLGGDEFMVLLRSVEQGDAEAVLARISQALSQPTLVNGEPVMVSASIGVVSVRHGEADDVIKRADHEMYRAKQSQGNDGVVRIVGGWDS